MHHELGWCQVNADQKQCCRDFCTHQVRSLQLLTNNLAAAVAAMRQLKSKTSKMLVSQLQFLLMMIIQHSSYRLYILISSLSQSGVSKLNQI